MNYCSTLVVGGNRGIGLAIARRLKQDGAAVTVTSRSGEAPDGLSVVPCDVQDVTSIDNAFRTIEASQGTVEVLVFNAGILSDQMVALMKEETFTEVIDTNLTGAYRVVKRAVRGMIKLQRGRLIFLSSVAALSGSAGQANYASSKAGLIGFARSLALELGALGITSNVIAPGLVQTGMTSSLTEERKTELLRSIPLRRLATAEEVSGVAAFLAGADASYVTGAVVPVDGGLGMGH